MTDRELMQQALEALEGIQWPGSPSFVKAAITALRERLAQPVQEPVAWMFSDREGTEFFERREEWEGKWTPLYTTPQPRQEQQSCKPWVGLTEEEIYGEGRKHEKFAKDGSEWFDRGSFARAIEAKLREKNT